MEENGIELITTWIWHKNFIELRIHSILGGGIPQNISKVMIGQCNEKLHSDSQIHKDAKIIVDYLMQEIPEPPNIDLGGHTLSGTVTHIDNVRLVREDNFINVRYFVAYTEGLVERVNTRFELADLPIFVQDLARKVNKGINNHILEWFWGRYGKGEMNPTKWKADKVEIFISYRESGSVIANQLYHYLGTYEDCSVFLPRIDKIDMQAGMWMDQLMRMIGDAQIFLPILTHDYLDGPVSKPELDQALRQELNQEDKRIVPILVDGTYNDYINHFLGGYQMVSVNEGLSEEKLQEIVYLCLGISRNPYE
jgi:hypothetical protein